MSDRLRREGARFGKPPCQEGAPAARGNAGGGAPITAMSRTTGVAGLPKAGALGGSALPHAQAVLPLENRLLGIGGRPSASLSQGEADGKVCGEGAENFLRGRHRRD